MHVVIIGSGISAIIVAKTFLEYNHKVSLIDSNHYQNKEAVKKKNK
jgi:NADH dehydrogenase FAD-containing subunit